MDKTILLIVLSYKLIRAVNRYGTNNRVFEKGVKWRFNNGRTIMYKTDHWVPTLFSRLPEPKRNHNTSIVWIHQLLEEGGYSWNNAMLQANFRDEDISHI